MSEPEISPFEVPADRQVTDRVTKVLASLRPLLQSDGGDLEFVEMSAEGVVRVRLTGACIGCPSSSMTLTMGIERNLMAHVPEVKSVVMVPN